MIDTHDGSPSLKFLGPFLVVSSQLVVTAERIEEVRQQLLEDRPSQFQRQTKQCWRSHNEQSFFLSIVSSDEGGYKVDTMPIR